MTQILNSYFVRIAFTFTLDVSDIGSVTNKGGKQRMQHAGVRPALQKDAEVRKRPADVELYHVHAALLVLVRLVVDMIRAVQSGLSALKADVVQLLGNVQFVADGQLPHFAAYVRRKTLPPHFSGFATFTPNNNYPRYMFNHTAIGGRKNIKN